MRSTHHHLSLWCNGCLFVWCLCVHTTFFTPAWGNPPQICIWLFGKFPICTWLGGGKSTPNIFSLEGSTLYMSSPVGNAPPICTQGVGGSTPTNRSIVLELVVLLLLVCVGVSSRSCTSISFCCCTNISSECYLTI